MNQNIEIKLIGRDSLPEQLVVYRSAFHTSKCLEENLRIWEKKHYENPLGDSIVFGAYCDGRLVGMNSYMPVEYNYNGKSIPMLQSCESGVIPEYQGKGIWSKVVRAAIDYIFRQTEYKAVIGFPNYRNSYPGFRKMGWETLFGMNNYIMVNNPFVFAKAFTRNRVIQIFGRLFSLQRIAVNFAGRQMSHYQLVDCFSNELFWNDDPTSLSVSHSDELVNWKKDYKSIKTAMIKKDGVDVASCIYGLGEYEGTSFIRIEKIVLSSSSNMSMKTIIAVLLRIISEKFHDLSFFDLD